MDFPYIDSRGTASRGQVHRGTSNSTTASGMNAAATGRSLLVARTPFANWRLLAVGGLLVLLGIGSMSLVGCGQPVVVETLPAKVVATSPLLLPVVEWDEYVGRVDAIEEVEVRARVSGHLASTHFDEGQIVNKGDLLCVLDQRPFVIALEQASADLAAVESLAQEANARLGQTKAELEAAQSQLELADQMHKRALKLAQSRAIADEEVDVRQTALKQAVVDVAVKRAQIAFSKAAFVTAEANLRASKSRIASAKLNLEYTEVTAPVTGRVGSRVVTDGNLISGGTEQSTLLTTIVFPFCVLFVFLVHSAEYESWTLPLAIILIAPICLPFALGGVWLRGMDNNLITQINFVLLIGLAAKNAVLIVEFAKQQEEEGMTIVQAAVEACRLRLRPIIMTSFAFILGVLPLARAVGPGFEMRQVLGTAVFSGMLGVTLFGLVLTPAFYVGLRKLSNRVRPNAKSRTKIAGTAVSHQANN